MQITEFLLKNPTFCVSLHSKWKKVMEDFLINEIHVSGNRNGNSLINRKMILRVLGVLLFIEAILFLLSGCVSIIYDEPDYVYFIYCTLLNLGVGSVLVWLGRHADSTVTRRDGYCIVAFTWLLFTAFGMLPFYISGVIPSISNAFFETMSGFTTTGATILDDIEALSHGMLFWRSFTQWIGGLGIIFFTIAVLPIFGVGNQVLFSAEATGVIHDKIHPKISVMAKWLWFIYLLITVTVVVLLMIGGMDFFDAVCHAFATAATGGYSTKQASIAHWNSAYIEYVIAIFMLLASINFSLYFMCLRGQVRQLFKDDETKAFLTSVMVITLLITVSLVLCNGYGLERAFRVAFFQVASIHTSCGFATEDYMTWAPFTWVLLLFTMMAGGCTGSTSGGIKLMRVVIILRNVKNEFNRLMHPRAVLPVKVNGQAVSQNTLATVETFVILYLICAFVGWILLVAMGVNLQDALWVVVSSMGNIGPGLGMFGPAFSWNSLPEAAKWVTSFLMLIGRLEVFGILLMFAPSFWEKR